MVQVADEQMEEMKLRFSAIMEYIAKNESYQEEIKQNNSSITDSIKGIAEGLQVKPSAIKKAVKEYRESIKQKEDYEEKEDILALLIAHKFIK